jgi:hypothetical protein
MEEEQGMKGTVERKAGDAECVKGTVGSDGLSARADMWLDEDGKVERLKLSRRSRLPLLTRAGVLRRVHFSIGIVVSATGCRHRSSGR